MLEKNSKKQAGIQSVKRAFSIIEYLCKTQIPASVIDISNATGIQRTTIYGLLNELLEDGYVAQSSIKNKYVISGKLYGMSYSYPNRLPVVRCADDYMRELVEQFDVTAHLGVLNADNSVLLVNVQFPTGRKNISSGSVFPIHASANGKVLLAYMDRNRLEKALEQCSYTRYTKNTIVDRAKLMDEIDKIRNQGYGMDVEEFVEGTVCIGFPIFGENGEIVASMSLSGNKSSVFDRKEEIVNIGINASKHCSNELGWPIYRK